MKLRRVISAPVGLASQAQENLRFIRETMSRSVQFTAVPGWGMVGIGCSALLAYLVARQEGATSAKLSIWVAEAVLAASLGALATFRKARREGLLLSHAVSRPFFSQPGATSGGGRTAHRGSLESGQSGGNPRDVAPIVRHGSFHGRCLLGKTGAFDGPGFCRARWFGAPRLPALSGGASAGWVWRPASSLWNLYREAVWRLKKLGERPGPR